MDLLGLLVGLSIFFCVIYKWNDLRYGRKGLPQGTMGWPLFGESMEILKYGPDFMKKQRTRYGSFFKTHMLGSPTIISMDPELNRYILLNEGKGLVPGYPQSMLEILGRANIGAVLGSAHRHMRGSMLSLIGPPMIKDHRLQQIDKCIRSFIADWEGKTIDIQEETEEMAFLVSFHQIFGGESCLTHYKNLKQSFDKLMKGTLSLPINLPGTAYHKGLQARKEIIMFLRQIVNARKATPTIHNDILGQLLRNDESTKYHLRDDELLDQIISILHSGFETVSTTTMMALKYLHDHPKALQELKDEHFRIREVKREQEPITWDDYKSMSFTRAVVFETLRLAAVVNGPMRKTVADIQLNGYIIPKGWRIYVYTRESNYDPLLYPEPLTFNPWRWLQDKKLESNNYCFLFGGGGRMCPGKELGIVNVATFLHYFVTQYSWEEVGGEEIVIFPRVEAPNGLHIKVFRP